VVVIVRTDYSKPLTVSSVNVTERDLFLGQGLNCLAGMSSRTASIPITAGQHGLAVIVFQFAPPLLTMVLEVETLLAGWIPCPQSCLQRNAAQS